MARQRLTLTATLILVAVAGHPIAAAPPRTTVFNDIVVNEAVDGDIVAFEADVHLGPMADVSGDVVIVGGDLHVDPRAHVGRHILAVFGEVDVAPEAVVDGRVLAFSSLSNVTLQPGGQTAFKLSLAVRVLTSGGWLLVTTALAFGWSARFRYGVWLLPRLGFKVLVLGIAAGVTFFAALVAVLGLGPSLGVPLAAALTVLFFALRAVGLTVIGGFLGGWLLRRGFGHPLPLTAEVFVGVLLLLVARFLPVVGGVLWSICSLASLGTGIIALATSVADREVAPNVT